MDTVTRVGVSAAGDAVCSKDAPSSSSVSSTIDDTRLLQALSPAPYTRLLPLPHQNHHLPLQLHRKYSPCRHGLPKLRLRLSPTISGIATAAAFAWSKSSMSTPASVGIGIGAPVAAFALAVLVFALYRYAWRRYGEEGEEARVMGVVSMAGKECLSLGFWLTIERQDVTVNMERFARHLK